MPTSVTLTKETKTKISFVVRDGDQTTHRLTVAPNSPASRAVACRAVGCDDGTLLQWLDALDRSPDDPRRHTVTLTSDAVAPKTVRLVTFGGEESGRDADFRKLLRNPTDLLLAWEDQDYLCCLDIDYHGVTPPPVERIEAWVAKMAPTPLVWHLSRGGGVHAFFVAKPPFTARHLAAAAALRWATIDPTAGVELKRQVRCAGEATIHEAPGGQDTLGTLSAWIGCDTPDADAVEDWLATNDVQQGHRYPHDKCPIDPSASGDRDPVAVGELGVYCHRCAGKGRSLGSRSPGFAPWAALCGSPSSGEVGRMVRHMTHWGHAGVVLRERYGLPEALAKPAYEAALLAAHDGDPRVSYAFHEDTADMCRVNDSWYSLGSAYTYKSTNIVPMLQTLPQTLTLDDKGRAKARGSCVAYLNEGVDLTARGYQNIQVTHGYAFAKQFLPPPPHTSVAMPAAVLARAGNKWCPAYIQRSKRKGVDWAWVRIGEVAPGIHRGLVEALLCAAGSAQETKLGLQPLIFVAGPSAAAKTMTTLVAAGIMGSASNAATYTQDEGRLKSAIKEAAVSGAIVRCDEFLKESKRVLGTKWSPKVALETLLTLTPSTLCHVLFVGARRLGTLPAVVITETVCPPSLKQYTQIARRVRFLQLHGRRDWEKPMAAAGLTGDTMPRLRLVNDEIREACDTILSDVTDRFFCVPMTWGEQADACGLPTIETSADFENPIPQLLRFYQLVCTAPEQQDKHATRHKAKDGWRRISRHEASTPDAQELLDLLDAFSDEAGGARWGQSMTLQEKSWGDLLKVGHPVQLDLDSEGGSVAWVRFRVGQPHNLLKLNGAIKDPTELT